MNALLKVENLTKEYNTKNKTDTFKAIDKINLNIEKGKSLGLIGESGCGKSTLGRICIGLDKPTKGQVYFNNVCLTSMKFKELRKMRKNMQIVFQNSYSTFNPKNTIGYSIEQVIDNFCKIQKKEKRKRVIEVLNQVGLDESFYNRYPDELSGGQCQRANIARAIVIKPDFIVCDEPVASLDFAIRKNILNLLNNLKEIYNITYLFITHDLSTIKYVCKRIAVMYLGKIVEILDVDDIEKSICHPYTIALFNSVLISNPNEREKIHRSYMGDLCEDDYKITGCKFYNRCEKCMDICKTVEPNLKEIENGHIVACHMFK